MDESGIWFLVVAVTILLVVITFLTSVTVLHKRFIEKNVEKYEKDEEGNT